MVCGILLLLIFQITAQRCVLGITTSPKGRQLPGTNQIALNKSALTTWRNSSTSKRVQNDGKIGILIEKEMYPYFEKAMLFQNSILQSVKMLPKVVENNPYAVLQAICNFTGKDVSGLAFICEEPCSEMTSFASLLGWSGVMVKGRSTERSLIFPKEPTSFLDISPAKYLQNDAVIELFVQFQWKLICLIHDTKPSTASLVADLKERMKKRDLSLNHVIELDGTNVTIADGLKRVYGKSMVFVLYCSSMSAESVLEIASRQRLTSKKHAWIVGEMILENRGENVPESFPIGLIGVEYVMKDKTADHIADAINVIASGINHMTDSEANMNKLKGNCDNTTVSSVSPLYRKMINVTLKGKTGIVSFDEEGHRTGAKYAFLNLRKERNTQKLFWQNVGFLENDHVTLEQIVWPGDVVHTPSGLPRASLRVVMYEVAPLIYVKESDSTEECQQGITCTLVTKENKEVPRCCYGLCIDLINMLSQDLDFDPIIRIIEGGRAGSFKHGKWTGLVGSVLYGEADMGMSSISITEERSKVIDFTEPFLHTGSTILVAKRPGSFKGDGFLRPFELESWLFIFGVLYLVAFVIFIFESKNPGLQRSKHKHLAGQFDIHVSIWLIYSRLFSGNLDAHVPRFVSSRVVLSSWAFSSLLLIALYTANLAAFMVQKEQAHYIDSINDSIIQNPSKSLLRFTTIRDTSVENYFKVNYPRIFKYMRQYQFNHSSDGVQAVKDGKIDAFIWEAVTLDRYVANDSRCNLLTVGKQFDKNGFAAVFSKGSEWTKKVSEKIMEYQTSEEYRQMAEKWQEGSCKQTPKAGRFKAAFSIDRLDYVNLSGVFYLLAVGIGLSFLVLIGENFYWMFQKKTENRRMNTRSPMNGAERLELQKKVGEVREFLDDNYYRDQQVVFLSKVEKELQETLQELRDVQAMLDTRRHFLTPFDNSRSDSNQDDILEGLTLSEVKSAIESMKLEEFKNSKVERESVV
ncbi:glutamate receptor ionotropic, NMDA 2A-like [Actinia tenebrosa]|uniref:Glutamate receptor ionotropic, NMDA 2A-like n=1 Tax=Actinia tenebrosa TaxID=6105 RepID=A0A6P8J2B4_ACTTE|nr:glutamate receptor ionotropic, NMDA 2A-like [Actinia tenebrosa]XP_031571821.1 glutamate receptor ionotropic, NMDA 2A-like [Actinia tenebrosa]